MGTTYYTNPVIFLINTLFGLYILALMLRFLFQWMGADYYNPVSQFLVNITQPPLKLLRRIVPSIGRIDSASIVFMLALQMLAGVTVFFSSGVSVSVAALFIWALTELITLLINVFLFSIIIRALISWINPDSYNPVVSLLYNLTEPLLGLGRKIIPPISGIDLSALLVIIGLQMLKMLVLPPLQQMILLLS